ncbi:MAG TPA: hypothetical protein VNN80_19055 [Polyangiaceae bacterium]|nr:hypothetical protein [Polyangiaceae bacterium]
MVPLLWSAAAAAASGDGVGVGPVFAITLRGSAALGWEVALSKSGPWLKLNLGGSYHVIREEGDPAFVHYAAWEPWIYGGATLGVAVPDSGAPRFMYGLWEAYADGLDDSLYSGSPLIWAASVAVGWRGFGSVQQFYVAPKLWYIRGFDFFS